MVKVQIDSRNCMQRSSVTGMDYLLPRVLDEVGWSDALRLYADEPWLKRFDVLDKDLLRK